MDIKRTDLFHIPFSQLKAEEGFNVRYDYGDIEALAQSIVENGLKNPIRVHKERGTDNWILTDGHRRYKALTYAVSEGLLDENYLVPSLRMEKGSTDLERTLGLILHNDGKPLNLLEEAEVYRRLIDDFGKTQEDIAKMIGRTPAHVSNLMLLISKASPSLKNKIREGKISASLVIQELKHKESASFEKEVDTALEATGGEKVTKKHFATPKQAVLSFLSNEGLADKQHFTQEELIELLIKYKRVK